MLKQMSLFSSLEEGISTIRLGVIGTGSVHILKACNKAWEKELVELVFIGNRTRTDEVMEEAGVDFEYLFHEASNPKEAAQKAVSLAKDGEIDLIIKGSVETGVILRAILDKKNGIPSTGICSAVSIFEYEGRFLLLTDAAINIYPNFDQKVKMIQNAIGVARSLGIESPRVAALTPTEVVQERIKETVDGAELTKMAEEGYFGDAYVHSMALDVALLDAAAKQKRIENEVAGRADILFAHDLNSANILHKSFSLLTTEEHGAVVVGTGVPLVITSRSEDEATKFNSILLAVHCAQQNNTLS